MSVSTRVFTSLSEANAEILALSVKNAALESELNNCKNYITVLEKCIKTPSERIMMGLEPFHQVELSSGIYSTEIIKDYNPKTPTNQSSLKQVDNTNSRQLPTTIDEECLKSYSTLLFDTNTETIIPAIKIISRIIEQQNSKLETRERKVIEVESKLDNWDKYLQIKEEEHIVKTNVSLIKLQKQAQSLTLNQKALKTRQKSLSRLQIEVEKQKLHYESIFTKPLDQEAEKMIKKHIINNTAVVNKLLTLSLTHFKSFELFKFIFDLCPSIITPNSVITINSTNHTFLTLCCEFLENPFDCIRYLIQKGTLYSDLHPLRVLLNQNEYKIDCIEYLIANITDLGPFQTTPLHIIACFPHSPHAFQLTKLCLNNYLIDINAADEGNSTMLHYLFHHIKPDIDYEDKINFLQIEGEKKTIWANTTQVRVENDDDGDGDGDDGEKNMREKSYNGFDLLEYLCNLNDVRLDIQDSGGFTPIDFAFYSPNPSYTLLYFIVENDLVQFGQNTAQYINWLLSNKSIRIDFIQYLCQNKNGIKIDDKIANSILHFNISSVQKIHEISHLSTFIPFLVQNGALINSKEVSSQRTLFDVIDKDSYLYDILANLCQELQKE